MTSIFSILSRRAAAGHGPGAADPRHRAGLGRQARLRRRWLGTAGPLPDPWGGGRTRIAAKLVVGPAPNGFSTADPAGAGMMDAAGFDAAAPAVIADFIHH